MNRFSSLACIVFIFTSAVISATSATSSCRDRDDCEDCFRWCKSQVGFCTKMASLRQLCRKTCQAEVCFSRPEEPSWTDWDDSTSCSKPCGGGTKTQTRECTGSTIESDCEGDSERQVSCNTHECAVWSKWKWTDCSASCGGGSKNGTRTCLGGQCLGMTFTIVACNQKSCTETKWVPDGDWSPCPVTCGGGIQRLKRKCINGRPGDRGCPMNGFAQIKACNLQDCPTWSEWTWTNECPTTCGPLVRRTKTRTCSDPEGGCPGSSTAEEVCPPMPCPIFKEITEDRVGDDRGWSKCSASCGGGLQIRGEDETQICNTQECPSWTSWTAWSSCSRSCSIGMRTRTRTCPVPGECPGSDQQTEDCFIARFCMAEDIVDEEEEDEMEEDEVEEWSAWSNCPVPCDGGTQSRSRGDEVETQICNTNACPGLWDVWSSWTPCSVTCGNGQREATRVCLNENGGAECEGNDRKLETCNTNSCPAWSSWGAWSECSKSCGGGLEERYRSCIGGFDCEGKEDEARLCNIEQCPVTVIDWTECSVTCGDGVQQKYENGLIFTKVCNMESCYSWGPWDEDWSDCSRTCGGGSRVKTRKCSSGFTEDCEGENEMEDECNTELCVMWSSWSDWSSCSLTCGDGNQTSTRKCSVEGECTGETTRTQACNTQPCPITTEWSECSATCGSGQQSRLFVGTMQVQVCGVQPCASWTEWSGWSPCNETCGSFGVQSSQRSCRDGRVGDVGCEGEVTKMQSCNRNSCAHWGSWSASSGCSVSCGEGLEYTKRECIGGEVGDGECVGKSIVVKSCEKEDCPMWSAWTSTECSRSCGGYIRHRRHCVSGEIGQRGCIGLSVKFESCGDECAQWSTWSEYSECDVTCGEGIRSRTRVCDGGEPGDDDCMGGTTEIKKCYQQNCNPCEGLKNGKSPWCVLTNYYTASYMCTTFAAYMDKNCPLTCCKINNKFAIL